MSEPDPLLDAILASGVKLPTLSGTALRVHALAANEQTGPAELAAAVGRDPVLTGEFIRVANSPVFRTRTPARSVKTAITLLGRTRTLALIASNTLRMQFAGVAPKAVQAVWTDSVAVAEAAYRAALASRLRSLADLAYLAGLIHDAGIPVLLHRFPDQVAAFEAAMHDLDAAALAMDAAVGADHAAIGSMVARNWKLPPEVSVAIGLHHHPDKIEQVEPHAASLAILIAAGRRLHNGPIAAWPEWAPLAETYLRLDTATIEGLEQSRPQS
jgi:HD-like signal output (HDOD) protein